MAKTVYVAFLRAVNVGGTGKLPMAELKAMCESVGFEQVKTYIASGNVVFISSKSAKAVKSALEKELLGYAGKEVGVIVRTAAELKKVLSANPFSDEKPNFTVALLLDTKPPSNTLDELTGQVDEQLQLGSKEIYVFYGSGMGSSKLKFPAQKVGTARNMNTIKKMVELSAGL